MSAHIFSYIYLGKDAGTNTKENNIIKSPRGSITSLETEKITFRKLMYHHRGGSSSGGGGGGCDSVNTTATHTPMSIQFKHNKVLSPLG